MAADVLTPDEVVPAGTVRIAEFGGDSQTLDYEPGLTAGGYLDKAGVDISGGKAITANGRQIEPDDQLEPGAVVVVAGKVANG